MALELTAPTSIEADAPPLNKETWARKSKVEYTFPGTKRTAGDEIIVTWYDGKGHMPKHEGWGFRKDRGQWKRGKKEEGEVRAAGRRVGVCRREGDDDSAALGRCRNLFPTEKFKDYKMPKLEDINHYTGWAHACLGDGTTKSNFDYAGPLTETVLLGGIAIRFPKEQLLWDSEALEFTHHADATARLTKQYRKGWALPKA